jgi:hypothetical protein
MQDSARIPRLWLRSLLLSVFVAGASGTAAAAQLVTGQVVDAVTGTPVANTRVAALDDEDREHSAVVADSLGRFVLRLTPGGHRFRVQHIAYEPLLTERLDLTDLDRLDVEVRLGPRPVEVEALIVRVRRSVSRGEERFRRRMDERRALGLGRFITQEDIADRPVISVNHLLAAELGLELGQVGGTEVIVMRSRGRTCLPTLFIDGHRVTHNRQFPLDLAHYFAPDMIAGIEIYRQPIHAPAELGLGRTGCGAIVVWSRSDFEGRPHTWRRTAVAAALAALMVLLHAR